jgi:hypothetical protein
MPVILGAIVWIAKLQIGNANNILMSRMVDARAENIAF